LVPLSVLRQLFGQLIDIHGQNDQQGIFEPQNHRRLLDRFAGAGLTEPLQYFTSTLQMIQQIQAKLQELGTDPAERDRQLDLLNYQITEIEAAGIKLDEEPRLVERHRLLANREKIMQAVAQTLADLNGQEDESMDARLSRLMHVLESAARSSDTVTSARELISQARDTLQEAVEELIGLMDEELDDPGELQRLDERLDLFYRLKKKYGGDLPAVLQFLEQAQLRRDELSDGEARFIRLSKQKDKALQQLVEQADLIRSIRLSSAAVLERQIALQLEDLGMKGVRFAVQIEPIVWTTGPIPKYGLDKIAFMISANPGEPLKPLARIASGGEASRVLLAIKTILARADETPVLIFDEIDTGVSGVTASRVAEKLYQISRHHQVFCITHMAQIAAMADQHILIQKKFIGERTQTELSELNHEERIQELMRLLSGGSGDDKARQLADHLLEAAAKFKLNDAKSGADPLVVVP
jgi:DNA repair protein RecN (Recombination protein N)